MSAAYPPVLMVYGVEWNGMIGVLTVPALEMTSSCLSVVQCCFIGAISRIYCYFFVRRLPSHPWGTVVDEYSFVGGGTNFFPLYASVVP